jgi:hypothetical protein
MEGYGQSAMGVVYAFIARYCSNTAPRAACDSMFVLAQLASIIGELRGFQTSY